MQYAYSQLLKINSSAPPGEVMEKTRTASHG